MDSAKVTSQQSQDCPRMAQPSYKGIAINVSLVCVSAVLASLTFPPFEIHWLAWVCLVPLLIALSRTKVIRASGWLALLFGLVFLGFTLPWLATIFDSGFIGVLLLGSLPLILFGLSYRLLWQRSKPVVVMLMTPALWLAVDWMRCEGWYFQFSWAQLGFTQVNWTYGAGLYPLIGVYGVTFLVVLVNAALVGLFQRQWSLRPRAVAASAVILGASVFVAYGTVIQDQYETSGPSITALVAQDELGDWRRLAEMSSDAVTSQRKPDLTAWPEYATQEYPLSDPKLLEELQAFARDSKSVLVLGCKEYAPDDAPCDILRRRGMGDELFYNTALILSPVGEVLGRYYKTHPIQLFADGVPGRSYPVFDTSAGRLGVAICYDLDFASTALRLVQNGPEILVAPTFDSTEWGIVQHIQHSRMAEARVLEVGRGLVRPTTSGVSQILSPHNSVTIPCGVSQAALGSVPLLNHKTPYVRYTHRLPMVAFWLSVLWMVGCLYRGVRFRHRRSAIISERSGLVE